MDGSPEESAIELRGLVRRYRLKRGATREALKGLDITIDRGSWTALLGPNGAGKSTLMRIVATSDVPDEGEARVLGLDPARRASEVRARLGVVFQRAGLDPLLTVGENLRMQAALHGIDAKRARDLAWEAAERLAVADRFDDRVRTLSGGLARRVDLGRALLTRPELLLLDEPTAGLDHAARSAFLKAVRGRQSATGMTVLMSTHLMDEAAMADRVVMMDRGEIVADGSPDELRRELSRTGGELLHTSAERAEDLRSAGLEVAVLNGRATGAGDRARLESAARALIGRGASFEIAPPTLGDVYLARTGRSLTEGAAP